MVSEADKEKRIIRSTKELPKWFDLQKYKEASHLGLADWYEILLQRQHHFYMFDFQGPEKYKNGLDGKSIYYDALVQSRNAPLSPLTDDIQIIMIGGGKLQALKYDKNDFATSSHAISPLSIRRLYQQEHRLKKPTRNRLRAWFDTMFGDFGEIELTDKLKKECDWALSFIDLPIFDAFEVEGEERNFLNKPRGNDFVEIDLTLPDKILIKQFEGYLHNVRNKYPDLHPGNPYKTPEFKKWVEYGLLPYLDLKLWEIENDVSIPYRVLADAIFPDGSMGEEMIRKTTKKIADLVMTRDYVAFVSTLAAQEIAEKI